MIPALVRLIIAGVDLFGPTEVVATRAGLKLLRRGSVLERSAVRRTLKRGKRVGILDAATSGIRKGITGAATEVVPSPTRVLPPMPMPEGPMTTPGFDPFGPLRPGERIPVPPNAYTFTEIPDRHLPGKEPPAQKDTKLTPQPTRETTPEREDRLSTLLKADIALRASDQAAALAERWLPSIEWHGTVNATGFKTTPTRTVVHYALAVAFGLIKQQRVSSASLVVNIDYNTNNVSVGYVSKAYWLTEIYTLALYAVNGVALPPKLSKDVHNLTQQAKDVFSRSMVSGIVKGPAAGLVELGTGTVKLAGDALKVVIGAYQNLGRLLGPLAVYDMGDETLYGGRASLLLRAPDQPEPFKSMQTGPDGKPVPLLTRLPAPNPQPPVPPGEDPSTGYSVDLRSLVAQALYDPGIAPPVPDTNVSLPTVHKL